MILQVGSRVRGATEKVEFLGRHIQNSFTLPETNIAPENRQSQKETNIPTIHFQVLC